MLDTGTGFIAPSIDVAPVTHPDATDVSFTDVGLRACVTQRDCAAGEVCLQGYCSVDDCLAGEPLCGSDRCQVACVPTHDLCAGVSCGADQTCFEGLCVNGCFPAPCVGVVCPSGQYCNEDTGACTDIHPCTARCNPGYACDLQCLPHTPCDTVSCPSDQLCVNGRCLPNPCSGVVCASGALCIDGVCTPTCGCNPPCTRSSRDRCVVGRCQCDRLCTPTTPCGTDDGCGGHCPGPCANPRATCNPVLYSCDCARTCPASAPCGADDGCGGRCDQGCGLGERCDTARGLCICETICPSDAMIAAAPCGSIVANLCAGGPTCGVGTACPDGLRCNTMTYTCECLTGCAGDAQAMMRMPDVVMSPPSDGGAGTMDMDAPCGAGLLRCAGICVDVRNDNNHCGNCGSPCPFGTTCTNSLCACPSPLTLCGGACVNTAADGNNCGDCGTICAGRSYCDHGYCTCIPACTTDPNQVVCGAPVPNLCPGGPSCGTGTMCASGAMCNTATGACVCVPRCPPGVLCGATDGCGGQCVGVCPPGATCTQDPINPHHEFCSTADCVSGCRCDQVCAMNHCVPITCPGGASPCPCQCCPDGSVCVGGAACVARPP